MKEVYIYGDINTEHLRINCSSTEVSFISHEHTVQGIADKWRDRYLLTVPKDIWEEVVKEVSDERD